jgi:C-terminal processing protease CtpA/Prc
MDQTFTRGAAVAAFTLGSLMATAPVTAQVTAGAVRVRGDSVVVRVIDGQQKVVVDSMMRIWHFLQGEPGMSEQAVKMRQEIDAMMLRALAASARGQAMSTFMLRAGSPDGMREVETRLVRGWIGINPGMAPHEEIADSTGYFVRYFKYPEIISVEPNSPAQRAGIIPGDVLVAYDGNDVVGRRIDVSQLLVPERRLAVTVQRDGESKEFSMTVAPAPLRIQLRRNENPGEAMIVSPLPPRGTRPPTAAARAEGERVIVYGQAVPGGNMMFSNRNGVLGAALITINADLARAFKTKEGVVIQECAEGTPAYESGLRPGDAIISVAGMTVTRAQDVQPLVFSKRMEKAVVFQIVRDKKPMNVTVKW